MTDTQSIALKILRTVVFGESFDLPENVDWEQVFQDLRVQTVSELAADWASSQSFIPADIRDNWIKLSLAQLGVYWRIIFEQNALYKLLTDNEIPMAVLKGASACIYYPKPESRRMGDIDFIVPADCFEKAEKLLIENGYCVQNESHINNLHMTFLKNDVDFELHHKPNGIKDDALWEKVRHIFDMTSFPPVKHNFGEYEFSSFPDLQNGLVILLHIKSHVPTGLGLRQVVDWMMYVNSYLDDAHWPAFKAYADELGISNFAKNLTRMCQLYLGLPAEKRTWCMDADEKVPSQLIEWIMTKGNFGIGENYWERKGRNALMGGYGFIKRLKYMQSYGLQKWELARKCILVRPFAWTYELKRYLKFIFARPKPIRTVINDFKSAKKQRKFIDNLTK